jgi:hypothetical protein
MTAARLTRQQMSAALEQAAQARRQGEAAGEREALDEWPDGPPVGDGPAMERYDATLRSWHEKHVGLAEG